MGLTRQHQQHQDPYDGWPQACRIAGLVAAEQAVDDNPGGEGLGLVHVAQGLVAGVMEGWCSFRSGCRVCGC
jgi:hypothetical protein